MAIVPAGSSAAPAGAALPALDRYGWRYVTRELPDGGLTIEQAPLTLEDGRYQAPAPDERGRPWLAAARTWLGIAGDEIVCYDWNAT